MNENMNGNMKYRSMLLLIALIDLTASLVLFTEQQYFSMFSMLMLLLLALLSGILFVYPAISDWKEKEIAVASSAVSAAAIAYEIAYTHLPPGFISQIMTPFALVAAASAITAMMIYAFGKFARRIRLDRKGALECVAALFAFAAAISIAAYFIMYMVYPSPWSGSDEIIFNYYAASAFAHGANPYGISMQPFIEASHVQPTILLNGSYEFAYDYPSLSFLPYVFLPLLGITSMFSFVYLIILVAAISALIVYMRSGYSMHSLAILGVWLGISYAFIGTINSYLAVSLLLLLSFIFRKRPLLSGAIFGLSAATIQISWFAIPLFAALSLRENGKKNTIYAAISGIAVFFAANFYFILISPLQTLHGILLPFEQHYALYGLNIAQFSAAFFGLPSYYFTAVAGMALLISSVGVYLYPRRLMPLIAVVPMMLFFLLWRNITVYGLAFVPLLLAVYFQGNGSGEKPAENRGFRRFAYAAAIALIVVSVVLAAVLHVYYESRAQIGISSIMPVLYSQGQYPGQFSMAGVLVNLTAQQQMYGRNVSFYVASRSPNGYAYFLRNEISSTPSHAFMLNYSLPLIGNNTKLFIMAFDNNYTASKEMAINPQFP